MSDPRAASAKEPSAAEADSNARLRRKLIKFVFRQYGQSQGLDAALGRLHKRLRDGSRRQDIDESVDVVLDEMLSLADEANRPRRAGAVLSALGLKVHWSDPAAAEQCDQLRAVVDEAQAVQRFADLVNRQLAATAPDGGWHGSVRALERMLARVEPALAINLSRLRARLSQVEAQAEFFDVVEEIADTLAQLQRGQANEPHAEQAAEAISETAASLQKLIEHLSLPTDYEQARRELIDRLTRHPSEPSRVLISSVAETLAGVHRSLQGQVRDIAGFLKTTQLRLQALHSHLLSSANIRAEALRDGDRLEELISGHVAGIRNSMDDADDFAALKAAINAQLSSIDDDVAAYVESENQRVARTEQEVTKLTTQLEDLANQTLTLQDALAEEQTRAKSDALTGVPNRLHYEERLRSEYEAWKAGKYKLALVVIDIDLFKSINDEYGHHAGDKVLATVAAQLSGQIRGTDFFARYGGEEFVLLLPGTSLADAERLADKLRRNIEDCRFRYGDAPVPVTVSCGVAEFRDNDMPEAVFQRADDALYRAKEQGRNCTCADSSAIAA